MINSRRVRKIYIVIEMIKIPANNPHSLSFSMCQVLGSAAFCLFCPWSQCVSPSAAETGSEVRGELGFESTSSNPLGLEAVHLITIMVSGNERESPPQHRWTGCSLPAHPQRAPWEKAALIFPVWSKHSSLSPFSSGNISLECFCYKLTFRKEAIWERGYLFSYFHLPECFCYKLNL